MPATNTTGPANSVWHPSSARRVIVDGFNTLSRGSGVSAPSLLVWPQKDPVDVLDYEIDFSPAIIGNDADGLASVDVTITPSGAGDVTATRIAADGAVAAVWLSGGTSGTTYAVQIAVQTRTGRTMRRTILLPVTSLSSVDVPASALTTSQGATITDQNGNPILIGT